MTTQYILSPSANETYASMPSGTVYVSDSNSLIYITNGSAADIAALINAGCIQLNPVPGGGFNSQPGTAYTIQPPDNGNLLIFTSASAVSVTLPATLPTGFKTTLLQYGAGKVTAGAGAGATLTSPNSTFATTAQWYMIDVRVVGQNGSNTAAQWNAIVIPN